MRQTLYICGVFVFLLMGVAQAGEQAFFSALPDVPIKSGLSELEDMAVVFDKPQGRIVEVSAHIKRGSYNDVLAFYEETLPQMGWHKKGKETFQRGLEFLRFELEEGRGKSFVRISVAPR